MKGTLQKKGWCWDPLAPCLSLPHLPLSSFVYLPHTQGFCCLLTSGLFCLLTAYPLPPLPVCGANAPGPYVGLPYPLPRPLLQLCRTSGPPSPQLVSSKDLAGMVYIKRRRALLLSTCCTISIHGLQTCSGSVEKVDEACQLRKRLLLCLFFCVCWVINNVINYV